MMNLDNLWIGCGRTTADIKTNTSGKIGFVNLACDSNMKTQDGKKITNFVPLKYLGEKKVNFMQQYVPKGTKIRVSGEFSVESYTDKDGNKKQSTFILVDETKFCESKGTSHPAADQTPAAPKSSDGFMNIPEGIPEELPFN